MSIWNSSPQRELTTNPLSGKLGADHASTAYSSSADLPTPASPRTTSARPRPDRRSSRSPSSAARSRCRSNKAGTGSDRVRMPISARNSAPAHRRGQVSRPLPPPDVSIQETGKPQRDGTATAVSSRLIGPSGLSRRMISALATQGHIVIARWAMSRSVRRECRGLLAAAHGTNPQIGGLTIDAIAEAAGVERQTICRW